MLRKRETFEILSKLASPKVLIVAPVFEAGNEEASRHLKTLRRKMLSRLRERLIEDGYTVIYLPDEKVARVRKVIDDLAGEMIDDPIKAAQGFWSMGLGELCDTFLTGTFELRTRKANLPGGFDRYPNLRRLKVVTIDGSLQLVRFNPEEGRMEILVERRIGGARGVHPDIPRAMECAINDMEKAMTEFASAVADKLGSPRRSIVVYVKGLRDAEEYAEMEGWLSNCDPGVEKARGVIFDRDLSKFILTLAEGIVASGGVRDVTGYIAKVLDKSEDWKLVKHGRYSIMIEREM